MRIGHYDSRLGAQGGIASYMRRVGRAQEHAGHEVCFLCHSNEGDEQSAVLEVENDTELFSVARTQDLDVLHLHKLRSALDAMLAREGRIDMAQACFDFLPVRARLDLAGWPEMDIFAH